MTDAQLLEQFVQTRSEQAFAELVARHIGWVSAAARRRLRDPGLADDATQATFILLAQKAPKLRRETILSAWLFAALRYTCIATERGERRRKHREEQAAMQRAATSSEGERVWHDVAPQLDEAVARLRERDRRAVLLRFYENKTFAQVGELLGVSEDAARKRVDRAVDKLSAVLRRKGPSVMPSILTATMIAHVASPPVTTAATSIATAALSASASSASGIAKAAAGSLAWAQAKAAAVVVAASIAVTAGGAAVVTIAQSPATSKTATTAPASPDSSGDVTLKAVATTSAPAPAGLTTSGVVVTPDGKPLANATIHATGSTWPNPQDIAATVSTDAAGRFRVTLPPGMSMAGIIVDAPPWGFTSGSIRTSDQTITLRPAAEVELTVLDPDGNPAPDVAVAPHVVSGGGMLLDEWWHIEFPPTLARQIAKETDANGVVRLARLPQGSRLVVDVFDDRFARPTYHDEVQIPGTRLLIFNTLKLQRAASISGRVTLPDGKPAAKVRVAADGIGDSSAYGYSMTDADGRYVITRLKAGTYNAVADFTLAPGEQPPLVALAHESLTLDAGQTKPGVDFVATPGTWIRGKVTLGDTNEPVEHIAVGAYGPARPRLGGSLHSDSTDADGTYALRAPPGEHLVYIAQSPPAGYIAPNLVDKKVTVGAAGATVNFEFSPAPGKPVAGRVVTADGKPARDAWITAVPDNNTSSLDQIQIEADADGRFNFKRLKNATLSAFAHGGVRTTQPVKVKGGEKSVVLRVVHSPPVTLRGKVVDAQGKPIRNASVSISTKRGRFSLGSAAMTTDAQGNYEIESLRVGDEYSLHIKAPRFGNEQAPVKLKAGEAVQQQPDVVLPRADSFVAGTIVGEDGKPMPNLTVTLHGKRTSTQQTRTDAQGRFEFTDVVAGERLSFSINQDDRRIHAGEADAGTLDARFTFKQKER